MTYYCFLCHFSNSDAILLFGSVFLVECDVFQHLVDLSVRINIKQSNNNNNNNSNKDTENKNNQQLKNLS